METTFCRLQNDKEATEVSLMKHVAVAVFFFLVGSADMQAGSSSEPNLWLSLVVLERYLGCIRTMLFAFFIVIFYNVETIML